MILVPAVSVTPSYQFACNNPYSHAASQQTRTQSVYISASHKKPLPSSADALRRDSFKDALGVNVSTDGFSRGFPNQSSYGEATRRSAVPRASVVVPPQKKSSPSPPIGVLLEVGIWSMSQKPRLASCGLSLPHWGLWLRLIGHTGRRRYMHFTSQRGGERTR